MEQTSTIEVSKTVICKSQIHNESEAHISQMPIVAGHSELMDTTCQII